MKPTIARAAIFGLGPLVASLLPACAVAPAGSDETSTTAAAIADGTPSTYPVVQVSGQPGGIGGPCSGTLISDSWVLTGFNCAELANESVTVCTTPQPGPCAVSAEIYLQQGPTWANLIHLATPLEHLPSYPALSTTPITVGEPLTCAGTSAAGPTQGPFEITGVESSSSGLYYPSPAGTAQLQGSDMGGGCFQNATLSGVLGKGGWDMEDVSQVASWAQSTMCGGAMCGTVVDGENTLSCGTCADGDRCSSGVCVPWPHLPPPHCIGLCM
jgi:hypothetical protein